MKKIFIIPLILLTSCAVVCKFDQASLDADMAIKKEALALIQHANQPASQYTDQILALNLDLSSKLAQEKGKGKKNWFIEKQWEILVSPDHLLGKFLKDWQSGTKTYSQTYIDEESVLIGDSMDQIIEAEAAKERP